MKKKLVVPAAALAIAAAACAGYSGESGESSSVEASVEETESAGGTEQGGTGEGSGTDGSPAKDTLIIATANETPSVTTNEHSAVAGTYLNQMTHNGLFKMDENL